MTVDGGNSTNRNEDEKKPKVALKRSSTPSSRGKGTGITLKKPSGAGGNYKLRRPGDQTAGSNAKQDEDEAVPGLKLIKPSVAHAKATGGVEPTESKSLDDGKEENSLNNLESGLRLKTLSSGPPTTIKRKKPEIRNKPSSGSAAPTLRVKDSPEDAQESKLSTPGSLQLKKLDEKEPESSITNTNTGLRLRRPTQSRATDSDMREIPESTTDSVSDSENQQDVMHTLTLKKPKGGGGGKNVPSLASGSDAKAPDLTPPGLDAPPDLTPPGLDAPPDLVDHPSSPDVAETPSEKPRIKIDASAHQHPAITPPAQTVQFSRKQKKGLTKKQKQQIVLVWVPVVLVILGLSYALLMLLTEPTTTETPTPNVKRSNKSKKQISKPDRTSSDAPKESKTDGEPGSSAATNDLEFPENLLEELEQSYGHETKEQFLEDWKKLSDEEQENYLKDIGVLPKSGEE